ncbi:M20/M25/M40 family metallo-hydrolase [Cecembia lonarensis]|uniref:Carboxypeptidase Q n=1 Tax=Cecembia lonarensis (strain CCUG 58316 / KCTC 22772 / LW9) TaxID=1225176 RepID=K1KY63_CECL9|nr:M20/M25/M40 family metallo-hydrolase [Cecembia lonarensis]EKB47456.1 Aminopeptidase S [Cecembia lonarensis LW9]
MNGLNRFIAIWLVFFLGAGGVFAQEKVDLEMMHRIKSEGIGNSQIEELSFYLTDFLGPRLSGSTNLRNAREWTAQKFKDWGLSNVKIDEYGEFGRGWDVKKSYIAMKAPYYAQVIGYPKAWTNGTNGLVKSEVVLLEINSDTDFEKYRGTLKGKVVTTASNLQLSPAFEAEARRWTDEELEARKEITIGGRTGRYTPEMLAQLRAQRELDQKLTKFLLEEEVGLRLTGTRGNFGTVFHTRAGSFSKDKLPTVPELEIAAEHHGRIYRLLKKGIPVEIEAEVEVEWLDDDYKGYNVLAEIPGTDRNLGTEIVMLGAHLDSWHAGTGGNDNAAGVAVMMEAIRILKDLGFQPKRTIRIALWGEEEQGLYGSRGYVQKYVADRNTKEKKAEWNKISAYYNLDNGSGKIRGIYLEGNDMLVPVFEEWFKPFHEMGANTVTRRNTGSTDHVAFDAVGVPGFQFIQDPIDYGRGYHTNMDVYERMQFADMTQAAVIIAAMVYNTAQRAERLPRKPWN